VCSAIGFSNTATGCSIGSRSKNACNEHVADLAPFLCASESGMITSQNTAIDGGW
jgi:NAD(P)-dependent dehydrogenase (short-subunit alcohol dehydrogenase family)